MIVPSQTGPPGARPTTLPPDDHAPDRQEGDAADAIRGAEAALAHQNSTTAQVDLQVVTAVLNAHQQNAEGQEALNRLQHDIEAAVTTRSDLDTPAGARDFQRFLIGKLRDIRAVVANASLDDTSNSALMAAWTSLYNTAKRETGDADEHQRSTGAPAGAYRKARAKARPAAPDTGLDAYLGSLPVDDSGLLPEDMPAQTPSAAPPMTPVTPTIPSFGGGEIPGGGAMPGLAMPGGFPLSGPLQGSDDELSPRELDDALLKAGDADDEPSVRGGHGDEQVDHRDAEPTVPAAARRPSRCPTAKPSPLPALNSPSGHQGRSGWHTHRRCFPPGGDHHSASGDRGERPGRPVAAHTRGYRHAHGSPRACPRRKPGHCSTARSSTFPP